MVSNFVLEGLPVGIISGVLVSSCIVLGVRARAAFREGNLARCSQLLRYVVFLLLLWLWVMVAKDLKIPFLSVVSDLTFISVSTLLLIKEAVSAGD